MLHERAEKIKKWLTGYGIEPVAVVPITLFLFLFLVDAYDPSAISATLAALVAMSPIWLPIYFFVFFWISWIDYIRYLFWFNTKFVLVEVQLPQTVDKNPSAIETFLSTLHNAGGETTFIARIWRGSYRPIWALEIASNEGRLGFYIHMRRDFRNIVEARLYGQFPEAKIVEVEDYAARIPFNLKEYEIFGSEYQKGTIGALPIKTYVDWGLDKDPKEEFKVDPLVQIIELLGQVGKNEYFWLQLVLKPRRNESEWYGFRHAAGYGKDTFTKGGLDEIKKMIQMAAKRSASLLESKEAQTRAEEQGLGRGATLLTQGERNRVDRIERSMSKLVFEVGIRVVYMAKKEDFKGINVGAIIRFFDTFRGQADERDYNSLGVTRGLVIFDYPWQDFMNIRHNIIKENVFFQYKNRAYFYVPYDQAPAYLTVEELATLWHFPSTSVQTPGLNRVPSRRAEAPVNLPVGS